MSYRPTGSGAFWFCEPKSLRECVSRSFCGGTAYDVVGIALIDILDRVRRDPLRDVPKVERLNSFVHVGLTDSVSAVPQE